MKYIVSSSIASIIRATNEDEAKQMFESILWEIEESYEMIADTDYKVKEVF